jgi:hypothetical protein
MNSGEDISIQVKVLNARESANVYIGNKIYPTKDMLPAAVAI